MPASLTVFPCCTSLPRRCRALQINDAEDAVRLLRAAVAFADGESDADLLYRLANPQTLNAGPLKKALE